MDCGWNTGKCITREMKSCAFHMCQQCHVNIWSFPYYQRRTRWYTCMFVSVRVRSGTLKCLNEPARRLRGPQTRQTHFTKIQISNPTIQHHHAGSHQEIFFFSFFSIQLTETAMQPTHMTDLINIWISVSLSPVQHTMKNVNSRNHQMV